jgi:hypothetical protein
MNFRPYSQPPFQHTPPTALIINESLLFIAAQQHLARRGIAAPENISLICPPSISSVTRKATKSTPSSKKSPEISSMFATDDAASQSLV